MRIFLIFIFLMQSLYASSQSYREKTKILSTIERRDTSDLLKIYKEWSENSIPIDNENIEKQYELALEVYSIYPVIAEYFYDRITTDAGREDVYILVNNSVKIDVSPHNLNLDSIYYETYKRTFPNVKDEEIPYYPRGCSDVIDEFERIYVSENYLDDYKNSSFILDNFRPNLTERDSTYKVIYEDESMKYLEVFNDAMTNYEIEQSLLKKGKSIEEIRKLKGATWGHYSDISVERESRQDFCYQYRLNIKDRVERIVFQPDFRTAFVSYVDDDNEFGTLYFEKTNSKWEFKEVYIQGIHFCFDCNPPKIR